MSDRLLTPNRRPPVLAYPFLAPSVALGPLRNAGPVGTGPVGSGHWLFETVPVSRGHSWLPEEPLEGKGSGADFFDFGRAGSAVRECFDFPLSFGFE